MRGGKDQRFSMLLGVVANDLLPQTHPIRAIPRIVVGGLQKLSPAFDAMYAVTSRLWISVGKPRNTAADRRFQHPAGLREPERKDA